MELPYKVKKIISYATVISIFGMTIYEINRSKTLMDKYQTEYTKRMEHTSPTPIQYHLDSLCLQKQMDYINSRKSMVYKSD
jgi:hypothetical protein